MDVDVIIYFFMYYFLLLLLLLLRQIPVFTSAVLAAQIGEPPHISEPDSVSDARQQKVELAGPCFSVRKLFLLLHFDYQSLGLVVGRGRRVDLC